MSNNQRVFYSLPLEALKGGSQTEASQRMKRDWIKLGPYHHRFYLPIPQRKGFVKSPLWHFALSLFGPLVHHCHSCTLQLYKSQFVPYWKKDKILQAHLTVLPEANEVVSDLGYYVAVVKAHRTGAHVRVSLKDIKSPLLQLGVVAVEEQMSL